MGGNICIIPARGGSKRIPRKNIREFRGRPIIEHSIALAYESDLFDAVIVSTDDYEIAELTRRQATVVIRDWEDENGVLGTNIVTSLVLVQLGAPSGFVCCLYPTAPLAVAADLEEGLIRLDEEPLKLIHPIGPDGADAGQWYWAHSRVFAQVNPMKNLGHVRLPAERVCDINTEEDWKRAEELYDRMVAP